MKIIGHRGARNEAPENTVEGFIHAQRNGCKHFELDIQLSADNELIIYHDKTLKRTSGIDKKIRQLTYSTLSTIDARLNTPGWDSPCNICSLEDVVNAVPDTESWQFEVKTDGRNTLNILADKLIRFIDTHDLYLQCHVTSSNKWFLKEIKSREGKIKTGFVCEYLYQRPINTCQNIGADLLALNEKLATPKIVSNANSSDIEVSCWTVNSTQRIDYLLNIGIHSIITDLPSAMIDHYHQEKNEAKKTNV